MKLWQRWNMLFTEATGFWGAWEVVDTTELSEGCYWIIPSSCLNIAAVEVAGEIEGCSVAAGSAEAIADHLPEYVEQSVFWYIVRANRIYPIGRWGLNPDFLDESLSTTEEWMDEELEISIEL